MSQGRYVWIAGKKVYLNPELQKEWDKLINKERYRARQEKICGQADYRRCNGDCFVCPWRKEGIVVSYETEHFAEGFGNDNAARGYGVVNCESTLEEKYIAEERYNHRTNVDVNSRMVCYDIKELGKQLKKLGMLIVQDQVWGRVTANRSEGKSTRYYMDEFHLLLREEQTAAYSVEIWKRFRKWGGIPTGITQNVKDLLASQEVENILENSDFICMLNQASGDREILAKKLGISPYQLSYVTQSGEGEGLLFYGNVILPFQDHFPKNTLLYKVMTTKLSDKAVQNEH